jgi:hypothetical protein
LSIQLEVPNGVRVSVPSNETIAVQAAITAVGQLSFSNVAGHRHDRDAESRRGLSLLAPIGKRKSFEGLCTTVEAVLQRSVLDGQLFLYTNKRRDRLKTLWWDRDGLVIV